MARCPRPQLTFKGVKRKSTDIESNSCKLFYFVNKTMNKLVMADFLLISLEKCLDQRYRVNLMDKFCEIWFLAYFTIGDGKCQKTTLGNITESAQTSESICKLMHQLGLDENCQFCCYYQSGTSEIVVGMFVRGVERFGFNSWALFNWVKGQTSVTHRKLHVLIASTGILLVRRQETSVGSFTLGSLTQTSGKVYLAALFKIYGSDIGKCPFCETITLTD